MPKSEWGGVAPSLIAHAQKQAPVLAMARTPFPPSAPQTGTSSSSTTRASEAVGSCSTPDGSAFDPTPVVIDRAAFNQGANAQYPPHIEQTELMDALVARGPHAVMQSRAMARSSSGPSARGTSRASGASTSPRARSCASQTQYGDEIAGTLTARYDSSPNPSGGGNDCDGEECE